MDGAKKTEAGTERTKTRFRWMFDVYGPSARRCWAVHSLTFMIRVGYRSLSGNSLKGEEETSIKLLRRETFLYPGSEAVPAGKVPVPRPGQVRNLHEPYFIFFFTIG